MLEYPIPAHAAASQKPTPDDFLGTKRAIIDPLVSKQMDKILQNVQKKSKQILKQIEEKVLKLNFFNKVNQVQRASNLNSGPGRAQDF